MDKERTEDLNPRSDDLEEKVRHLMDPNVPDEPEVPTPAPKAEKATTIQSISVPAEPDTAVPSAPELPTEPVALVDNTPDSVPPVKKITIQDHNKSPAEVAKELDKTIAELTPKTAGPEAETSSLEPAVVTDPATDKAVEEIIAGEGDELLEIEDAVRDTDEPVQPDKKPGLGQKLKALWANPGLRKGLLAAIILGITIAAAVPPSRYFMLNTVGVRASSSALVVDNSTGQPLKNVQFTIGSASGLTDSEGKISLPKIKLGITTLTITKRAFAPITQNVTIGWGSNPLGDFKLQPTGTQYSFKVTDFLSAKPISKIEASTNDANAISDDKGIIRLTIDKPGDDKITVMIKGDDYRTEQITINPNDKGDHPVKLVPARKQVFVSKRSGKYDLYSIYIDGKDEKLVLPGSGTERDDMVLVSHPTANITAYVSTRGNQRNSDGFLLSNLILVNIDDNSTTNIVASERVQVVDWSGDYLVYVVVQAASSANSPKRYRLVSYNYIEGTSKELAASNFFNDVIAAAGALYYAPSSAYQTSPANFYKINPDGSGAQTIFGQEVWNIFRTSYDHLALAVQQQWYDYQLGDKAPTKLNSAPTNQTPRVYTDSPDGKHSIWVDNRDGKGVLLSYDLAAKVDTSLKSQSGLTYPVRWLSNKAITYRVKSDSETADYALNIEGGTPVKIRDVTNSGGIDRWYYY